MYDLFLEYFAGWKKDIVETKQVNKNVILVTLRDGREYEFGKHENGEIYLKTVKESE